jgi:hypothetical protein
MQQIENQYSPTSEARPYRIWLGFVYTLATVLAASFVGAVITGIAMHRGGLIFVGLLMCVSFALFWRDVGSRICQDLRRRRDRAINAPRQ